MDKKFWKNKKIFLTGHTGFKGSWLSLMLLQLGSIITGYSLPAKSKSLFQYAGIKNKINKNYFGNILDYQKLYKAIHLFKPDIIFHLAAQPLVLDSYRNPKDTFNTNSTGTLNVLEATRFLNYSGAIIIVTTDKVYKNNKNKHFDEKDEIGVTDPYGSSKVCSEIISETYGKFFLNKKKKFNIAVARSGNVIGGGDFSKDRIIPDFYKCCFLKKKLIIRNPASIRPWQHVLEPLHGYLLLAKKIFKFNSNKNLVWNFGPSRNDCINVRKLVSLLISKSKYKNKIKIKFKKNTNFIETKNLLLNSNKSINILKWKKKYNINQAINCVAEWYESNKKDKEKICIKQIKEYIQL